MTTQKLFLTFALFLSSYLSKAQYVSLKDGKVELGFSFGATNFLGDLGGNKGTGKSFLKDNNIELTKAYKGLFFTYYPKEWIGVRLAVNQMVVEADDAVIKDEGGAERLRLWRNLSFKSNIVEGMALLEILPTYFLENNEDLERKFRPILFAGVGIFSFNPKAYLNGQWVDLRPLRTEGQGFSQYPGRKTYGKTALTFPLGVGFKYYLNETTTFGFEAIHRFTNTDYIDDVSTRYINPTHFDANLTPTQAALAKQLYNRSKAPSTSPTYASVGSIRGDPKENDGYYTMTIKVGWRLGGEDAKENRRLRRQMRCYY
jgi:hypothetical protein